MPKGGEEGRERVEEEADEADQVGIEKLRTGARLFVRERRLERGCPWRRGIPVQRRKPAREVYTERKVLQGIQREETAKHPSETGIPRAEERTLSS